MKHQITIYDNEIEKIVSFIERGEEGFYEDEKIDLVERTAGKPTREQWKQHYERQYETKTSSENCIKIIKGEMGRRPSDKQRELIPIEPENQCLKI